MARFSLHPKSSAKNVMNLILEAHAAVELSLGEKQQNALENEEIASAFRKSYARLPTIQLPNAISAESLSKVLSKRESVRNFDKNFSMKLKTLGSILSLSVKPQREKNKSLSRPYPSAGARYPVEIYLATFRFEDLSSGIYYYDPYEHTLKLLLDEDISEPIKTAICSDVISEPNLVFIVTAAFYRSCLRYGGRGYRYALLEAGAVAQTIDLSCRANGLSAVWIGGFAESIIHELLDIDWEMEVEAPILLIAVGAEKTIN